MSTCTATLNTAVDAAHGPVIHTLKCDLGWDEHDINGTHEAEDGYVLWTDHAPGATPHGVTVASVLSELSVLSHQLRGAERGRDEARAEADRYRKALERVVGWANRTAGGERVSLVSAIREVGENARRVLDGGVA